MTPAQKCRLAMAMVALAAYPAACAEQTAEEAGPIVHETPRLNGRHTQDTPESFIVDPPRPAAPRASRSRPRPAAPARNSPPAGDGDIWAQLARCESGNRNDGGAPYYGYFQFSSSTWQSVAPDDDLSTPEVNEHTQYATADAAPYEEQLARAQRLQARSGWGQWPACSRKLGLR